MLVIDKKKRYDIWKFIESWSNPSNEWITLNSFPFILYHAFLRLVWWNKLRKVSATKFLMDGGRTKLLVHMEFDWNFVTMKHLNSICYLTFWLPRWIKKCRKMRSSMLTWVSFTGTLFRSYIEKNEYRYLETESTWGSVSIESSCHPLLLLTTTTTTSNSFRIHYPIRWNLRVINKYNALFHSSSLAYPSSPETWVGGLWMWHVTLVIVVLWMYGRMKIPVNIRMNFHSNANANAHVPFHTHIHFIFLI